MKKISICKFMFFSFMFSTLIIPNSSLASPSPETVIKNYENNKKTISPGMPGTQEQQKGLFAKKLDWVPNKEKYADKKALKAAHKYALNELIIKLKAETDDSISITADKDKDVVTNLKTLNKLLKKHGVKEMRQLSKAKIDAVKSPMEKRRLKKMDIAAQRKIKELRRIYKLKLKEGTDVANILSEYRKDPNVEYAEPNYVVNINATPNDPIFPKLWGLHNIGQDAGGTRQPGPGKPDADIDAPEAWNISKGSKDVVVAIIDTGVEYTHSDLAPNMWKNTKEIPGNGRDDDSNGYIDDVYGINAINGSGNPKDDHFHGTHVAGTIGGAGNNGIGVTGVNWNVSIMALKFLDSEGSGFISDALECVNYAIAMGADIMSNSWGGGGYSQALADAIEAADKAGILFIAAAGNDYGVNTDLSAHYPSCYPSENVIAVAATDHNDELADFSNYGPSTVHVGAPGVDIFSSVLGNTYQSASGTSMAAPHVSGLAALIWAKYPGISHIEVKKRIMVTSDVVAGLNGRVLTQGRINAYRALTEQIPVKPHIYALSPYSGNIGDKIAIKGYNFGSSQGSGYVTFANGINASIVSWDDTKVECIVPTGAITGDVIVTTSAGVSNGSVFSIFYIYDGSAPYSWEEISGTGTNLGLGDDSYIYSAIPFNFKIDCQSYNHAAVNSNGLIAFMNDRNFAIDRCNEKLPVTKTNNAFIAGWWEDLNPGKSGAVYWQIKGAAPNRRLIIEWYKVPRFNDTKGVTFEIILYESSNKILLQYADVLTGNPAGDKGASATVGIQLNTFNTIQYSYKTASLNSNQAILFTPDPAFCNSDTGPYITSIEPSSGEIGSVITITGGNFGKQGSSRDWIWNTVNFPNGAQTAAISWTDSKIECVVPGAAISGEVTISNEFGRSNAKSFSVTSPYASGCVKYVPGNYSTIQEAIDALSNGCEIIVKNGTYRENINFRGKTITLRSENGPASTIIDGNGWSNVVTFNSGEGPRSVLKGFTIKNGSAMYYGGSLESSSGGGIFIGWSSPTIIDCNIIQNEAKSGGGFIAIQSSSKMINCLIDSNIATTGGGAELASSSLEMINCTVSRNNAGAAGGLWCDYFYSYPQLTNCAISSNRALTAGGLYTRGAGVGLNNCVIRNNIVENYEYGEGGAMYSLEDPYPKIDNCVISNNLANYNGGIAYAGTIVNSVISGNTARKQTGGIYISAAGLVDNCIISANKVSSNDTRESFGGGITIVGGTLSNSVIKNNNAINGGGIAVWGKYAKINNCAIRNNNATNGGGIVISGDAAQISNCLIRNNYAAAYGGGMACLGNTDWDETKWISNCTIVENTAGNKGGGVSATMRYDYNNSVAQLVNCIVWGNSPNEAYSATDSLVFADYCNIKGGWTNWGNHIITADPAFVGSGDYHLKSSSPCINMGTSDKAAYMTLPDKDFEGDLRPQGASHDIGYDEYKSQTCTDADKDGYFSTGGCGTAIDCNDNDAAINPQAAEICDGKDNDCDGEIDEGVLKSFYRDADGDKYGNYGIIQSGCSAPAGYVSDNTDCNDSDVNVHPGAVEICDGWDNDCDKQTDEGVLKTYYLDSDGDSFGNPIITVTGCSAPSGYVPDNSDCDDSDIAVNPAAMEICNEIDDNCNGQIDEQGCQGGTDCLIVVPDNYATIQAAIDAAVSGCEIIVKPNTYNENINFKGKNLIIRSERGALSTVINGNMTGSVVTFANNENQDSLLTGFTITGGSGTKSTASAPSFGGGIYCKGSSPSIVNCLIKANTAANGAGIYCRGASPVITNCTIVSNTATVKGGPILAQSTSAPMLVNSVIWKNVKGIVKDLTSSITIKYSDIQRPIGTVYPGEGNINAAPKFAGSYRLGAASPCIDAGTDNIVLYPDLPDEDMERNITPQDGNLDGTAKRDMGYDEYPVKPTVLVYADKYVYNAGEVMKVSAQVQAGKVPGIVADMYFRLILPNGTKLYYPTFGTIQKPMRKSWTLTNWGPKDLLGYTFAPADPEGKYTLEVYLTEPGTQNVIGRVNSLNIMYKR